MNTTSLTQQAVNAFDADEFEYLVTKVQRHFSDTASLYKYKNLVFQAEIDGHTLYQAYLNAFDDPVQRQIHTCHCCQRFFEQYGNLVFVDKHGNLVPAVWPENPSSLYEKPMQAVRQALIDSSIQTVFLTQRNIWKSDCTSDPKWTHFRITPERFKTTRQPKQAMAAKRESFKTLVNSLDCWSGAVLDTAINLLRSEVLYRSEHTLGAAEFLKGLYDTQKAVKGKNGMNLLWVGIAKAPEGFCHPRSGVLGTLLDDIAAGKPFDEVKRAFGAKMRPDSYQRPTALPSAGTVAQAEKLVEELGIASALKRRTARIDEVETFWTPETVKPAVTSGHFGHLKTKPTEKTVEKMEIDSQTMTWVKFKRTVLPYAKRIRFHVRRSRLPYAGITAPVDMSAPPIIQWDSEEHRNPYAWYTYMHGSMPAEWGLEDGTLVDVWGIGHFPTQWGGREERFTHHGQGVFFYLTGAVDQLSASMCLFPEILKAELHSVRSVIEAYSIDGLLEKVESPACGIVLKGGSQDPGVNHMYRFVVTTSTGVGEYVIDRFD